MTDLRQAAQQALEALERAREIAMVQSLKARIPECGEFSAIAQDVDWAIVTMKATLEQQQAEPMAWVWSVSNGKTFSMLFATKHGAEKFCSRQPLSAGFWPERISVIGSPQPEQQAEPEQQATHITWDKRGVRTVNGIPDDAPQQQAEPECEHCHGIGKTLVYGIEKSWEENCLYCNGTGITPAAQPEHEPVACEWSPEDDDTMPGTYRSGCGELWSFIDGGWKDNGVRFCHGCGGKVKAAHGIKEPKP
jgi:hypothetical protein